MLGKECSDHPDEFNASRLFADAWRKLEAGGPKPVHIRDVFEIPYGEFQDMVRNVDAQAAERLARSFYEGDGYILKGTCDLEFLKTLKDGAMQFSEDRPSTFHKMFDGCPDFHRLIDGETTKQYYADALRHVFFFFPWNDDPLNMMSEIYQRWQTFKVFSGRPPDTFSTNIPSDGVIDRFHIYHYPSGGGSLETHSDPVKNQRTIMAGMMSKRGVDYEKGGFYFVRPDGSMLDCEPQLDVGDFVCCYPSVLHGVEAVDPQSGLDWNPDKGRWFVGLYSVDSDHVQERDTISGLSRVSATG